MIRRTGSEMPNCRERIRLLPRQPSARKLVAPGKGSPRSLKEGSNGPLPKVTPKNSGLQQPSAPFLEDNQGSNGTHAKAPVSDPLTSDLPWSELDKEDITSWLGRAFIRQDRTLSSTSENEPEKLSQFFDDREVRQRFTKRCLIPTGTAMILGIVAFGLRQELGFPGLSVLGHNLVAGLLGFLMAFVTSTNYNRWLQARAGMCNITVICVDVASRASNFISDKDEDGIRARRELARYLRLLYTSIILTLTDATLWGGSPQEQSGTTLETSQQLRRIMMENASPSERRLLLSGGPRDLPFLVVDLIRALIYKDSTVKSFSQNTFGSQFLVIPTQENLRNKVDELFPAIGTVLSLALTPLPQGYRTIFSTLLNVLVYTFPFALVSEISWETPIVSGFLAFGYYGVYSMSQELMMPFRPRSPTNAEGIYRRPGLFSCNADWVRVMNEEFNRILVKKAV